MIAAPNSHSHLSAGTRFIFGILAALILLGSFHLLIHA
jgi:hypothetical protein